MPSPDIIASVETEIDVQPWQQISTRALLDLPPWLKVQEDSIQLPGGRVINDYYRIETPDYVIMAVCDNEGRFLLERQYKHGVGSIILTSPSGGIEQGESPLAAAKRELIEETGFEAKHWVSAGKFLIDGTRGICNAHFFLADGLTQVAIPQNDDIETCEIVFLTRNELVCALAEGSICLLPDVALYSLVFGSFGEVLQKELE